MIDGFDLAVAPDGTVVASAGPELLAWRGAEPLWRMDTDDRVIAVACDTTDIYALDLRGVVEVRRLTDGQVRYATTPAAGQPRAVAVHGGLLVVATDRGVIWYRDGVRAGEVLLREVTHAAVDGDATSMALLDAQGGITIVHADDATARARCTAGGRPWGVVWHPDGYWLVGAGESLRAVRSDGGDVAEPLAWRAPGARALRLGIRGLVATVLRDDAEVVLIDVALGTQVGHISVGRSVHGLGFAAGGALWLHVHGAEAVHVGLLTGESGHAAPHPGRVPRPASIDLAFDAARLRGAHAQRLTGGKAVAVAGQPLPDTLAKKRRWWPWVLGGTLLIAALALLAWLLLF